MIALVGAEGSRVALVGEVPTKQSSDYDPVIPYCRMIGPFGSMLLVVRLKTDF